MQSSITDSLAPRVDPPQATPQDPASQPPGYQDQHGSGAVAQQPARVVPGAQRKRRTVAVGGEKGTTSTSGRKRLAASALSPDPKVSADSDTAKLQELVLASLPKDLTESMKGVKTTVEVPGVVKEHAALIQEHSEAIRILRGRPWSRRIVSERRSSS